MFKNISLKNYRSVAKDFDKRMAKRKGLPLWLRISHAAGAELNRSNHAFFGGSWKNLADYVKVDGEAMPSRQKLYQAVEKAIELGYLTEESDVYCLVIGGYDSQKAAKASFGCSHHKIKDMEESERVLEEILDDYAVDTETGEIHEASVSPVESVEVPKDQNNNPTSENKTSGQDDTTESIKEQVENMTDTQLKATIDEDYDFGTEETVENDCVDEVTWFEGLDESLKDIASFGRVHRKFDGMKRIEAIAREALSSEYDWCQSIQTKYYYASEKVSVESSNDLVAVSTGDEEEW